MIKMKGHVAGVEGFNGVVTATVRDTQEEITCKLNNTSNDGAEVAFKYLDRTKSSIMVPTAFATAVSN